MNNVIRIQANFDNEINEFLKLLRTGYASHGILIYKTSNDSVNVLAIGSDEIEREEIENLIEAGKTELDDEQSVFTIE